MEPEVSPDGRLIAYTATTRAVTTIDSVAEDAHVWVVPLAGGQGRELNAALDRRSSTPRWTPDSRAVVYLAGDRGLLFKCPRLILDRAQRGVPVLQARGSFDLALGFPRFPLQRVE